MKLTTNGSDANLYAVTSQTQGNTSGLLKPKSDKVRQTDCRVEI